MLRRLLLFEDGRAEAAFDDGTAIILNSSAALSYFSADGSKRRCLAQHALSSFKQKAATVQKKRNEFMPDPFLLPELVGDEDKEQHYTARAHARWREEDVVRSPPARTRGGGRRTW